MKLLLLRVAAVLLAVGTISTATLATRYQSWPLVGLYIVLSGGLVLFANKVDLH